jgi:hypothetical protein
VNIVQGDAGDGPLVARSPTAAKTSPFVGLEIPLTEDDMDVEEKIPDPLVRLRSGLPF